MYLIEHEFSIKSMYDDSEIKIKGFYYEFGELFIHFVDLYSFKCYNHNVLMFDQFIQRFKDEIEKKLNIRILSIGRCNKNASSNYISFYVTVYGDNNLMNDKIGNKKIINCGGKYLIDSLEFYSNEIGHMQFIIMTRLHEIRFYLLDDLICTAEEMSNAIYKSHHSFHVKRCSIWI